MRVTMLHCGLVAGLVLGASMARAATIYDAGGFESPRFTLGTLAGQDAGVRPWTVVGATATVQNTNVLNGSQAVTFSTTTGNSFAYPAPTAANPVSPASRYVLVNWDEKVQQTTTDLTKFGPMMGIDAYDDSTGPVNRLGTFGVDATTGELIVFQAGVGLTITPLDTTVAFNAWNHFQIALDYASKTYAVSLNGSVVQSGLGFATPTAANFTDADLVGLKDDGSAFNLSGTAAYENYVVTTAASVPEPTALSLIGFGALTLMARRSRKMSVPMNGM